MYEHNEPGWEDACKGVSAGPSFYDICRIKSGAIEKFSVSPNPAGSKAEINIILSESRTLKLSLHDETGRPVKILTDYVSMKQGENSYPVDLGGLPAGIYLISATSDHGEQVVRRIAIAK